MGTKNPSLKGRVLLLLAVGLALTFATLLIDHILSDNLLKRETIYQYQNLLDERVKELDDALKKEMVSLILFANNNSHIDELKRAEDVVSCY